MNLDSRSPRWAASLIVLVTTIVYLPVWRAGFIWDDEPLIIENCLIKASDGLWRIWFTADAADYYPVTNSLGWLQWRLWGAHPLGYHIVNVLLHAANAVLVWRLLRRLQVPGSWLAGLIFALHPVNAATTAWISEQKNTLSMLFSLVAVMFFLRFDEDKSGRWYALTLMTFVLALLSKTAVVMLPVVLLGVVWWKRGPLRWRDIGHSVPFFVLSASLGLLTIRFQEQHRLALDLPSSSVGLASHLAVAGSVPWFYLCKAVWPVHLAVIYPQWQINDSQWASFLFGVALVGALLLFWWKRTSWGRPLLFALGCFIVMLFPVMGFFDQTFYRYASVADHWQYYSIVAPIALIAAAAHKIHDRLSQHQQTLAEAIAAAVLLSLAVSTWTRASTYVDNATLWRDNVLKYPTAYVAHHNLGVALAQAGKPEEAVDYFKETVHLKPDFADAHYNLGSALAQLGRLPEALPHFEQAVRLKPAKAEFQNNYANALMLAGQFAAAVEHYTQSVNYNPTSAETRCNLAVALERMGRLDEARAEYEEALRLNPDSADAQDGLRRLGAGK